MKSHANVATKAMNRTLFIAFLAVPVLSFGQRLEQPFVLTRNTSLALSESEQAAELRIVQPAEEWRQKALRQRDTVDTKPSSDYDVARQGAFLGKRPRNLAQDFASDLSSERLKSLFEYSGEVVYGKEKDRLLVHQAISAAVWENPALAAYHNRARFEYAEVGFFNARTIEEGAEFFLSASELIPKGSSHHERALAAYEAATKPESIPAFLEAERLFDVSLTAHRRYRMLDLISVNLPHIEKRGLKSYYPQGEEPKFEPLLYAVRVAYEASNQPILNTVLADLERLVLPVEVESEIRYLIGMDRLLNGDPDNAIKIAEVASLTQHEGEWTAWCDFLLARCRMYKREYLPAAVLLYDVMETRKNHPKVITTSQSYFDHLIDGGFVTLASVVEACQK